MPCSIDIGAIEAPQYNYLKTEILTSNEENVPSTLNKVSKHKRKAPLPYLKSQGLSIVQYQYT